MQPETRRGLVDACRAISHIQEAVSGLELDDFLKNWIIQSAVERQFMVIGEILVRIRDKDETIFNQIERSREIVGFRNVLVHGYDSADPDRVFALTQEPLSRLLLNISEILN